MNRTLRFSLLLAIALVGCHKEAPPPPPPPADDGARAHDLALRSPPGARPVDTEIREIQTRLGHDSSKVDNWVRLGQLWVREARESSDPVYYANAEGAASTALAHEPDSALALDLRGLVLLNQHRFTEARELAQGILKKRPADVGAHGLLSDALLELGDYDGATTAAQQMVDLKPNLPSYSRAAYLMWLRNDVKGSREAWHLAIDSGTDTRDPEPRDWVIVQAALLFLGQGDVAGADAGFQAALRFIPDYPPALVGEAQVAILRGTPAVALPLLQKAYERSPLLTTLWLQADAKRAAGDSAGAAELDARILKEGRATDPRTLALFLATQNRELPLAVELAQAETKVRDDIWTEDALSWALFRSGQLPAARTASDKATHLGTPDARLLFHAGAIRLAQHDPTGRALVEKALALNPAFDLAGAAEAKRLLANPG